ncbi:peptide deformylase [Vallitaleaceae bacterium 9-2]
MALRQIRIEGDEILRKHARKVEEITPKIKELVEDMIETMYDANGVGLAAPQIGVLKRIVIIDVGEGPIVMINPEIIERAGEQEGVEGCLSVPGKSGIVKRPNYVKAQAMNEKGEVFTVEGEELLARAICHELDHLDGRLYIDIAQEMVEYDQE